MSGQYRFSQVPLKPRNPINTQLPKPKSLIPPSGFTNQQVRADALFQQMMAEQKALAEAGLSEFIIAIIRGDIEKVAGILSTPAGKSMINMAVPADPKYMYRDSYFGGFTPLTAACNLHRFDIIQLLVDAGADVNLVNKSGDTPLTSIIRSLTYDPTPSHYDSMQKRIINYLIEKGAIVNEGTVYVAVTRMFSVGNNREPLDLITPYADPEVIASTIARFESPKGQGGYRRKSRKSRRRGKKQRKTRRHK